MKQISDLKNIIKQHKLELERDYKVKSLAIFGSYARGEQTGESDIDILVEFKEPVGLLFVHLADYLQEILGLPVDLVTPDAIKPNRKKYVMENVLYV